MDYSSPYILSLTHLYLLAPLNDSRFSVKTISSKWSVIEIMHYTKIMYISKQKFCDCSEVSCGDTAVMFDISHISVTVSLQAFCQLNVSHVLVLKSHLLCLKFISHCIKPIQTCSVLEYQNIKIKQNRYDLYFMPVVKLTSLFVNQ